MSNQTQYVDQHNILSVDQVAALRALYFEEIDDLQCRDGKVNLYIAIRAL